MKAKAESVLRSKRDFKNILVTSLALFAMFFGAGNLIFPTMIGVNSGTSFYAAIFGFLCTGVALPALAMVASATSREGITSSSKRMGTQFGFLYTLIVFLSTGVLYAIPRVATVSYEMSVKQFFPHSYDRVSLAVYTVVFFALVALTCLNAQKLTERIGAILTPALLILITILVIVGIFTLSPVSHAPAEDFSSNALATGVLQGYFTMDAIAAFVFGGVIISSLQNYGFGEGKRLFGATVLTGFFAALILAVVYVGLAALGARVTDASVANGAVALSGMSHTLFGRAGMAVFGGIVFLACLTTAAGLVSASSQYFCRLFPTVSLPTMVMIHVFIAAALSNLGLDLILQVVAPINVFVYPITIIFTLVCILDIVIPGHMKWAYRAGAWTAALFAIVDSVRSVPGHETFADSIWTHLPLGDAGLGWIVPAVIMTAIGLGIDVASGRIRKGASTMLQTGTVH